MYVCMHEHTIHIICMYVYMNIQFIYVYIYIYMHEYVYFMTHSCQMPISWQWFLISAEHACHVHTSDTRHVHTHVMCIHAPAFPAYSHFQNDYLFFFHLLKKQYLWIFVWKRWQQTLKWCVLVQEFELEFFLVEEKRQSLWKWEYSSQLFYLYVPAYVHIERNSSRSCVSVVLANHVHTRMCEYIQLHACKSSCISLVHVFT
jgi:hypothetical protein